MSIAVYLFVVHQTVRMCLWWRCFLITELWNECIGFWTGTDQ